MMSHLKSDQLAVFLFDFLAQTLQSVEKISDAELGLLQFYSTKNVRRLIWVSYESMYVYIHSVEQSLYNRLLVGHYKSVAYKAVSITLPGRV